MRRLALRRLRDDDGLSLVETVTALLVFSLIMTGLAAGMTLSAHTMALTKARNAATSLAQQVVESARTLTPGQLSDCTGGGQPANYTFQGTSYPVVTGPTPCVPYTSTKTNSGRSFTVTQVVIQIKTDVVNNQPIVEKQLIVTVAWTSPTPGSYTTNSLISGKNTIPTGPTVGLRININDTTGNLVTASNLVWDYTVLTAPNTTPIASGSTDDGTSGLLSVSPGTYICTVTAEDDAGQSYNPAPGSNPNTTITDDTISGGCTVGAGTIADWTTVWNEVTDCAVSTQKGTVKITVTDQSEPPLPVPNATVQLVNVNSNPAPANVTTDSNGVATFPNTVNADIYTYNVSASGYQTSTNNGPICVAPAVTTSGPATLKVLSTCTVSKAKGSVTVTVRDQDGNLVSGGKVVLTNKDGQGSPGSVNTNNSGVAFFNNNVLGGNYTITTSKTGYTTLPPQGPVCVATGTNNLVDALLPVAPYQGCTSTAAKGTLTVTITDQGDQPINGAKVTLTNANGHGGTPAAKTTDATGTVTWTAAVPGDSFTYVVTPPAGYADPGVQGPICVIAGQQNSATTRLTGIMTVKVTVTNHDLQPTKSYNVILRDSDGKKTINTTTINKNKSTTLTFANMPTDNYTIEVCIPIASSGNCDGINDKTVVYAFTAKGNIYVAPYPPVFTDDKGGS